MKGITAVRRFCDMPTTDAEGRVVISYHGVPLPVLEAHKPIPDSFASAPAVRDFLWKWDRYLYMLDKPKTLAEMAREADRQSPPPRTTKWVWAGPGQWVPK